MRRSACSAFLAIPLLAGCGGTESSSTGDTTTATTSDIEYPALGAVSGASGKGSFRFGAASAATQIEDQNPNTDWYLWTQPAPDGLGNGTFVGDAAKGYSLAEKDIDLLVEMGLDSYRFSMEWARIEPVKDMIDEAALTHYSDLIDALLAKNIRPMVTIHHFSNPVWIDDPRDLDCMSGPTDLNLCGFNHPDGGPLVAEQLAEHAGLLADRFGDRVDDWCTLNEPVNYLLASYGVGNFPPGKNGITGGDIEGTFIPAVRNYMEAHARMYDAIAAADDKDADGDGVPASIGLTKEVAEWVAANDNEPSEDEADIKAREGVLWVYQHYFVEAFLQGGFDTDLDGTLDEPHPDWKGKLDWLGVQYYFRGGVTGQPGLLPLVAATPCFGMFDFGACIPPLDPTYWVPDMDYEHHPQGLGIVLEDFGQRWPDLPLTVTESGIATTTGVRRAEMLVRALEEIEKARKNGVDVRGYYHWSLYDNFEWALGFVPRFGLYTVDYDDYSRTATEGATVLGEIAKGRRLTVQAQEQYGGEGPMTPEPESM